MTNEDLVDAVWDGGLKLRLLKRKGHQCILVHPTLGLGNSR